MSYYPAIILECDYCGQAETVDGAKTLYRAERDAGVIGWVTVKGKPHTHYCPSCVRAASYRKTLSRVSLNNRGSGIVKSVTGG